MNFSKILLPGLFCLIFACGERKPGQPAQASTDSSAQQPSADSSKDNLPAASVKSDDYEKSFKEEIKDPPKAVRPFIPEGFAVLDTATGDLNHDQFTDLLLVLKKQGEDSAKIGDEPVKRPLFILTGQPDNTYQLAAENDNAVYCVTCGGMMGDPYMGLVVKNGYFSIEHYGGSGVRWTRTVTFKYSSTDSTWYLHKDGGENFHAADPDKAKTKVYTTKDFGKVSFAKFDIYNDKRE